VNCAKTAEPIEIPFGLWAWLGPRNHVLDGIQIPIERGIFVERGNHCKVYGYSTVNCAKAAESIEMPFGMLSRVDPRNHVLDGVQIPHAKGQF